MDVKEEVLDILQKVWTKLQGLPQATPLELGAFSVLVLFVALSKRVPRLQKSSCGHWVLIGCFKIKTCLKMLLKRVQPFETMATFLFMIVLSCIHCCCCGKPKYQASRVQPLQPV